MTVIIDYGVGNLFSLKSSFDKIGVDTVVSGDAEIIRKCERIILPGVGAFENAAKKLRESGLSELLTELAKGGVPVMGVCLGMQLLFEKSFEYGEHKGLGLIKGYVTDISERIPKNLKVPHMGWNALVLKGESQLFKYIKNGDYVYFVHSYSALGCDDDTIAYTEYGSLLTAAVAKNNIFGCQFHPEKSGEVGLAILKAFSELTKDDFGGDKQ